MIDIVQRRSIRRECLKKLLFDGKTKKKKKNQCMTVEAILKEKKKANKLVEKIRRKQRLTRKKHPQVSEQREEM